MTAIAAAAAPPGSLRWAPGAKFGDWAIALVIFGGGFVMFEPAPYELLLCGIIAIWAFFGLSLNRHIMPMTVLMLAYVAGGIVAVTQVPDMVEGARYMAITLFLAISSIFFAALISASPERRLNVIRNAYIAAAVVVSLIGVLAYFHAIPGGELFLRYDRVKGTFKDPNVFGPFMILPATFLAYGILSRPLRQSLLAAPALLIVLAGIFLSFSRAAWGLTVVSILVAAFFAFLNERRPMARFRLVASLTAGALGLAMLLAAALTIPAVNQLFEIRAQAVQDYDGARLGRFQRHLIGFQLVQEKPLGIGPSAFARAFGEQEHNTWLKGFTSYGWLGGFSYLALVLWTIAAATPLLFKPRPWQGIVQCTYAVFIGHLLIHNVIDSDHWRHLFLIYGILWGAVAAEKLHIRAARRLVAAPRILPRAARDPLLAIPRAPRTVRA